MIPRTSPPHLEVTKTWASQVAGVRDEKSEKLPSQIAEPQNAAPQNSGSKQTYDLKKFVEGLRYFVDVANRNYGFGIKANPDLWVMKAANPTAKPGVSPARVVKDMTGKNAGLYDVGCYAFVYFAQLYGIMVAMGEEEFDRRVATKNVSYFQNDRSDLIKLAPTQPTDDPEIPNGSEIVLSPDGNLTYIGDGKKPPKPIATLIPDYYRELRNEHILKIENQTYVGWGLEKEGNKYIAPKHDLMEIIELYAKSIRASIMVGTEKTPQYYLPSLFEETENKTDEEQVQAIANLIKGVLYCVDLPWK